MFDHSRHGAMRDRVGLLSATMLGVVLATVTGCSTDPAPRPGDSSSQAEARQETTAAAATLLTVDATALARRWQLSGAEQTSIQTCMRRQGMTYLITDTGPKPDAGITTADTIGTGNPPAYPVAGPPAGTVAGVSAQDRYVRSLAPAAQAHYLATYRGPDDRMTTLTLPSGAIVRYLTGGCEGQARTALYGSTAAAVADVFVPQDMNMMFQHFLDTDRPYQSALDSWRRCMAGTGWPTPDPAAAIAELQARASAGDAPADLAQRQHAEAASDGHCDAASSLRRIRASQRKAFLARQAPSTLAWLDRIEKARQQTLRRLG